MSAKNLAGAEKAELEFRANKTTDDSLEATRRMLQLCDESNEAGFRTLVGLDQQGQQLDKVEADLDQINADMREAEKNLTNFDKFCGFLRISCGKKKKNKKLDDNDDDVGVWKSGADEARVVVNGQPKRTFDNERAAADPQVGKPSYVARITKDAREDEMEGNMTQVGNMLDNLRSMAIDMGNEVSNQNSQLERINQKATSNETRIMQAKERTNKLLR